MKKDRLKKVAIFDIDGTIFRSSLLIEAVNALVLEGVFPPRAQSGYAISYEQWLNRKGSYEEYITDVVKVFEKHIIGVKLSDFLRITKRVISLQKQRTYLYTRNLIHDLKKQGYFLLAISHSPKELLDEFCSNWGFNKVYGRMYEAKEGVFTGETRHKEEISSKANILRRFIEKEKLSLEDSFGVGDSEGDIPFLTFVQNPICFNPNNKLYQHAKKAGWKVVVERKDVIYFLDKQ